MINSMRCFYIVFGLGKVLQLICRGGKDIQLVQSGCWEIESLSNGWWFCLEIKVGSYWQGKRNFEEERSV